MTKKISLAEIASSLGVSKTLVSLVINNKGDEYGISPDTQQRVREKIKELNYQPNVLARGFRMGKTNTIGLIVSDISNRFYSKIARNIEDAAWERGYSVVICSTDENIDKEKEQIRLLRERKVDGLIISSSQDNAEYFNKLYDQGLPHVLIDRTFANMKSPNVSVDNFGGARMAARHLLTQGIKKIALIAVSPEHISTINDRIKGFESALQDAGISIPDDWFIRAPFNEIEYAIKDRLQKFYQNGDFPEAIFTLNNNLTSTCLMHLRKLSVKIPEQVALIGFDDVQYFGFTQPSISAIEQPIERVSAKAFDLLIKQIEKKGIALHERSVFLPVDIIIRESSVKTA
ncbi:MAG: LacI family transcriptional regulator [Bacteroidales bacterium]|nr:LacI family transcriptional regulator [Bacteroidales bacterium]